MQVTGAVQGVGFRPFLYRAATDQGLAGWIRNDTRGVMLEVEGGEAALRRFRDRVRTEPPPRAVIQEMTEEWLPEVGLQELTILPSEAVGERRASVLPDLATCDACLRDIGIHGGALGSAAGRDSANDTAGDATVHDRRYRYAFTNCTDCGPRFSIIRALPYDRPHTTMAGFELCPECRAEYENPLDRRFHAQPTACPACGPKLWIEGGGGSGRDAVDPVREAAAAIRAGEILALKGLGGFHLAADAADGDAVARLRERKRRPTKPLAVMVRDLAQARALCVVPPEAEALLVQPEAPIVLLERRSDAPVAEGVAPGNPYLGVMLPYTPLHHLLMRAVGRPIVATSGNLSDEPICTDNREAKERLGGVADRFVLHDRPIQRPVDDSVTQISAGAPRPVRRSRGYAPLPVTLDAAVASILAVGGHLKNTVGLSRGRDVFLSQHIGDLHSAEAQGAFERVIEDFLDLYQVRPQLVAHDLHPEYASTRWAVDAVGGAGSWAGQGVGAERPAANGGRATPGPLDGVRLVPVQHHHAHLASCLADNGEARALGVVWDGTGLGTDGAIWGGEFLLGSAGSYERVAALLPFRLPGGDAAVKEPRRLALALAHAAWGEEGVERVLSLLGPGVFEDGELGVLRQVLESGFRAPWTTSMGRLFDGVASLLGLRQRVGFEGEAAMAVEYVVERDENGSYSFEVQPGPTGRPTPDAPHRVVDWAPALSELMDDLEGGTPASVVAARFHNGLSAVIGAVAEAVDEPVVALTGGVFQNRILTEGAVATLRAAGRRPLLHRRVPANDGGLALGQVAVAAVVQDGGAN